MIAKDNLQRLEVWVNGAWVEAQFGQLEPGDHVRHINADGTPKEFDGHNAVEFTVTHLPSVEISTGETLRTNNKPMVEIEASKLVMVDSDHGGYKDGHCVMCGACGWVSPMKLVHKAGCVVARVLKHEEDKLVQGVHHA